VLNALHSAQYQHKHVTVADGCVVTGRLFYRVFEQGSCHCMWRAATDAGLMCDKAVLIGDIIKGTSVSIYLFIFMTY
jgi:hypothetical protein